MKKLKVVAAVIKDGDRYLCMQRCRSSKPYISEHWEFPGGKVKEGETDEEALRREIHEEMDWDIQVGKRLGAVNYDYPDFSIELTAFLCKPGAGEFTMLEHLNYRWLTHDELPQLNWTAADRELLALL